MKKARKLLALILALTVALTMGIATTSTVFGAGGGDKSLTLTGGKAGHTYTAYEIFTGTVEDGQLTNIQWGADAPDSLKNAYPTAAAAAKAIATQNDARAFAQTYASALTGGQAKTLTADGSVAFTELKEGYYVIVDTNNNTAPAEGDFNSAYVVKVVGDATGELKGEGVTSDKEVIDSTGNASASDAAAYNIGDNVPFKLTATTADNTAAYKKYHITFQDKQSTGLDAPTSFTVKVLGKTFTVPATGDDPAAQTTDNGTKITVTKVTPASGNTFAIKVEFEPVAVGDAAKADYLNAECNTKPITVEYTSKLNTNAKIGIEGNDNDFNVTYSNNPESTDGHEEGKTPNDTVKVFTYKTVIDKIDADGHALTGAGFTIYQEATEETEGAVKGSALTFADGVEHSKINADKYYVVKAMTTVSGNNAQFEFKGLADGNYVLVETTIPQGFNAFNSVEFTITSTVTDEGEDGITTLTGGGPFATTNPDADGAVTKTKKDGTNHSLDSGELYAEIQNNSGAELPSTGGIGTTIFYILGALLVVGCGIVLIARRRMTAK